MRALRAAALWVGLALLGLGGLQLWVGAPVPPAEGWGGWSDPRLGTSMLLAAAVLLGLHLWWSWERIKLFSRSRTPRYGAGALAYTLAVAGILGVVNLLAARHDLRVDTTAERFNSLSPQSERVLASLEIPVEAVAFLGQEHAGRRRARDLLSLMEGAARGRLRWEIVDPVLQPERARELAVRKPTEVVFVTERGTERSYRLTESDLMNALLEATRAERPAVCFTTGHGERNPDSEDQTGYALAARALREERYHVADVQLLRSEDLSGLCTVLLAAGPRRPFEQGEAAKIREFLEAGGSFLLLADTSSQSSVEDLGLDDLLELVGISLPDEQVVETVLAEQYGPLTPVGMEYAEHPVSEPLRRSRLATIYFDARPVMVHDRVPYRPEVAAECIVKTGSTAYAETQPGFASLDEGEDRRGPVCLAVAGSHDPQEAPVLQGQEPPPPDAPDYRAVAVGDSDFANNYFLSFGGNRDLLLNAVGWLARRGELLDLRPPERAPRALMIGTSQARLLRGVTVLGLPLVVLMGGLVVWLRRRRL